MNSCASSLHAWRSENCTSRYRLSPVLSSMATPLAGTTVTVGRCDALTHANGRLCVEPRTNPVLYFECDPVRTWQFQRASRGPEDHRAEQGACLRIERRVGPGGELREGEGAERRETDEPSDAGLDDRAVVIVQGVANGDTWRRHEGLRA